MSRHDDPHQSQQSKIWKKLRRSWRGSSQGTPAIDDSFPYLSGMDGPGNLEYRNHSVTRHSTAEYIPELQDYTRLWDYQNLLKEVYIPDISEALPSHLAINFTFLRCGFSCARNFGVGNIIMHVYMLCIYMYTKSLFNTQYQEL